MKLKSFACSSLLALSLIGPLSVGFPALAEEFKADVPQIDTLPAAPAPQAEPTADPSTAESKVLSGSVSALGRAEAQEKAGENDSDIYNPSENNLRANISTAQLKSLVDLFLSKRKDGFRLLMQRPKLTSEEFRAMNYGVLGLNVISHLDSPCPVVASVYPTCPAALAGIKAGDLMVKANGHVFRAGEGQTELWHIVCGRANTPVQLTIMRDGNCIDLNLMRMNIEDIKDDGIRGSYENLLSALGAPGEPR